MGLAIAPILAGPQASGRRPTRSPRRGPGADRGSARPAVLGYATVNAAETEQVNRELQSQAELIASECERRGLSLIRVVCEWERRHARALERPGLGYALRQIEAGEAEGLVVTDLSRLTASVSELGRVLEWFSRADARLVATASGLDTAEDASKFAVRMIIELARTERERLMRRTRRGMMAARQKGPARVADYPELGAQINRMRAEGMTLQAIADTLNASQVPTVRGGAKWRPSSVQAAVGYRRPQVDEQRLPRHSARGDSGAEKR